MDELESQIAKIQLGSGRAANAYVYLMAEKAVGSNAELFVVAELPLLNPAAESSCEQICLAIGGSLRRIYKRPASVANFEMAISQVNEELGKLASMGQTHWIDKLNCILAVKDGQSLQIASTGKIAAYMLRAGEFTDISCSAEQSHPLKTFETYASGKIRLNDLVIFSTTQLLNFISMDRLKEILTGGSFLNATQTIIELLKKNSGPEVAFGTILNLQVPVGQAQEAEEDLESYVIDDSVKPPVWVLAFNFIKNIIKPQRTVRQPQTDLPKVGINQRLKNFAGQSKRFWQSGKKIWSGSKNAGSAALSAGLAARRTLNVKNFKQFTPQKKFFFISAALLLLAFIANVVVTSHFKKTKNQNDQVLAQLKTAQNLIGNSQSALLYHDDNGATDYFIQAQKQLPNKNLLTDATTPAYEKIQNELLDLKNQLEKNVVAKVTNLGNLGQGDRLIKLPNFLGTQSGSTIVSYNKTTGAIEDNVLKGPPNILASLYIAKNSAAVFQDGKLLIWDFTSGQTGPVMSASVPARNNFSGLAFYQTNSRVYIADSQNGAIVSFIISNNNLSKPVVAVKDSSLNDAVDIAIDGSIYALLKNGSIAKFQSGRPANFAVSALATALSGHGKIYTQKDFNNIYILDAGSNRIVVLNKKGALISTITSDQFTNLKDFQVDEVQKTIYVLNDSSLLKVNY